MKFGPDDKYSKNILVSIPPRFTITKVKTYPYGKTRCELYDKKEKREYLEADLRSAKMLAREILEREHEWQMKTKKVTEGMEHGDTPKPKSEYFIRPFSIGGKIVQLHPVFGIPVKGREYMRKRFRIGDREGFSPYVDSPGQKAYDMKMSVWRWRVRIQTDEGWMLMGYIGRSDRKESLPPIRMGDRVEVSDLVLSSMTGGNLVTTALGWRGYGDTQYSEKQVDFRSRRFDRQLHGKVKRARA
jgi:hypothetical protein